MEDSGQSGYKIINIILTESSFKRLNDAQIGIENTNVADITTGFSEKDKIIFCNVKVIYKSIFKEQIQVDAEITMIGVFEKIGESELSNENFAKINAPSIIFPYIREHLSSLSNKAGIPPIILAPVNFVALNKDEKKSA